MAQRTCCKAATCWRDSLQRPHPNFHQGHASTGQLLATDWAEHWYTAGPFLPEPRTPPMGNQCSKTLQSPEQDFLRLHWSRKPFLPNPPSFTFLSWVSRVRHQGHSHLRALHTSLHSLPSLSFTCISPVNHLHIYTHCGTCFSEAPRWRRK